MANKTYAQIMDSAEQKLQDTGNANFATAELDDHVQGVLDHISRKVPWRYKLGSNNYSVVKSTTANSWVISLSTGDMWRYLWTDELRYQYNYPTSKRGFTDYDGALELALDSAPASALNVYLYLAKKHLLQKAIGTSDTAGAISTGAVVGAVSLVLKELGTGTINEDTKLTIAGDTTVYHVIADATIAANVATVSIWPALQVAADVDDVVTLALENTIPAEIEDIVARLIAARVAKSKGALLIQQAHTAITTLGLAATAIAAIAARIAQVVTDAASARTEAGKVAAAILIAHTQFDLMDTQVDLAVTALNSGNALLNTVPVGGGAPEYMSQAASDVGAASGFATSGQVYLQEASADANNAMVYLGAASREAQAASTKAQEALASVSKANLELAVTRVARTYEEWGAREEAEADRTLQLAVRAVPGEAMSRL